MPLVATPELGYPVDSGDAYRPSYRRAATYINEEHAAIFAATKHLPGWQDPQDSEKLYEIAFHSGEVILEIGTFGGRSATVELRAALRAGRERPGRPPCQFYGIDIDPGAVAETGNTLISQGLTDHALLYHGNLAAFHRDLPVTPTMVFVDGDHTYGGVRADLELLATFLAPGTPVQCHDYLQIPGIRQAVDESVAGGHYRFMGSFSGSALLHTTSRCRGTPRGLTPATFAAVRAALLNRYFPDGTPNGTQAMTDHATAVDAETAPARAELAPPPSPAPAPAQPATGFWAALHRLVRGRGR